MNEQKAPEMNPDELFLEETFTDQRTGTIRRMTPVDQTGAPRPDADATYIGNAQMMTPAGALPLNFLIEASSLGEAATKFSAGAQQAAEETLKELEQMRRDQASSIVVPGQEGPAGGMGGGIQIP